MSENKNKKNLRFSFSEPEVIEIRSVLDRPAGCARAQMVEKRWGYELIHYNSEYCAKTLVIAPGQRTSMHFHVEKHETLTVLSGVLTLKYLDKEAEEHELIIKPHFAFVIPPGFPHQLCAGANEKVVLVEASTYDNSKDSVRVKL